MQAEAEAEAEAQIEQEAKAKAEAEANAEVEAKKMVWGKVGLMRGEVTGSKGCADKVGCAFVGQMYTEFEQGSKILSWRSESVSCRRRLRRRRRRRRRVSARA